MTAEPATAPAPTLTDVPMPRLSDSMEEGTVLQWHKQVGDRVEVGEQLVEIETDKANMACESDVAGTLVEIIVPEGATAAVGEPIARIGDRGAVGDSSSTGADAPDREPAPRQPRPGAPPAPRAPGVKATPLARRIAGELGIDLAALAGSGPGGRIAKADVERAAAEEPSPRAGDPAPAAAVADGAKGAVETVEPSRLQQLVARRMSESKATAPHFYLQAEVEMSAAVAARARLKQLAAEGEAVPTFNDMVVKACAIALREIPRANGSYRDGRFELHQRVNVGIAVAAEDALVVPTVFDADAKGLRQIAAESRQLAARVRDGSITPPELAGGTFTVTNLGMFGVASFQPVINSPQAAILAVGELRAKPVVAAGEIVARETMAVTLACDHRILYGADGARFLARVRGLLEEPVGLAL